jgi:DNA repair protein RadC
MEKSNKSLNSIRKIAQAFNSIAESKYQVAEMSIVYNQIIKASDRPKISNSQDAAAVLRPLVGADMDVREVFYVLYLNRLNSVVAAYKVGVGGVAGCMVDIRLVMFGAISHLATGVILCHNHPSGNLKPSQPDIEQTKKIREGAKLFDIMVLDHLILSSEGHYSFADDGLI